VPDGAIRDQAPGGAKDTGVLDALGRVLICDGVPQWLGLYDSGRTSIDPKLVVHELFRRGDQNLTPNVAEFDVAENPEDRVDEMDAGVSFAQIGREESQDALCVGEELGASVRQSRPPGTKGAIRPLEMDGIMAECTVLSYWLQR
jgi:hypothetical protein